MSLREGEIIEIGYQRYHNEIKVGKTPKKLAQLENRIEVSYFVHRFQKNFSVYRYVCGVFKFWRIDMLMFEMYIIICISIYL